MDEGFELFYERDSLVTMRNHLTNEKVHVYLSEGSLWDSAAFESGRAAKQVQSDLARTSGTVTDCLHTIGVDYGVAALTRSGAAEYAWHVLQHSEQYVQIVSIEVLKALRTIAAQIKGTFSSNPHRVVTLDPVQDERFAAHAA